ncbi:MAG TPA: hypothetical protein VLS49_09605 [Usitatibacter sp.]|nr:hypothetical protein [Usitatibacter sp.]
MTKLLLRTAATFAAMVALAMPARATTYSIDYTDLWFNATESGWGVNFIQQDDVIFATLFVYGVGNVAQWFTASDMEPSPAGSRNTFTGQLYLTSGPYFGAGSFDPRNVTRTPVGTMTVTFTSPTTGTLQYSVNGATVTKQITRQTWRNDNLTGNYLGGLTATGSSCSQVPNGPILIFGSLATSHNGGQVSMTVDFTSNQGQASQCAFTGNYAQDGRLGSVAGNWSCTINGQASNAGNFTLSGIEAGVNGFNGHFSGRDQFCTYDGFFGGLRDVPLS